MSDLAIRVEGLSKQYKLGVTVHHTLRDFLTEGFKSCFHGAIKRCDKTQDSLWALKDVSFDVEQGECLSIVGANGSGKSTLLKILSRVTEPTEGCAQLRGTVGSLLEVGTGFVPELTGGENIYLSGAILGMKKAEITRRFDEIVAFAGIERFVDTPVKRYSSGMYVRLAFAVAAHLEPEILIVDEVLAVGDAAFQKKCLGKMGDVTRNGRTVLFVSHNMTAVESLSSRAIRLQNGQIAEEGEVSQVISNYLKTSSSILTERCWDNFSSVSGNDHVRLLRARVRAESDTISDPITIRTPVIMEFDYLNLQDGVHLNLTVHLYNDQRTHVLSTISVKEPLWKCRPFPAGRFRSICRIPGDLLNDGMYWVELLVVKDQGTILYRHTDVLIFEVRDVVETRPAWYGKWPGAVRPNLEWSTEPLASTPLISGDGIRTNECLR